MNAFEELIGSLTDEGDRKALENLGNKYPDLKGGYLRQSEFSRKMDEIKAKEKDFEKIREKMDEWEKWSDDNWDAEAGMTKAQKQAMEELARLRESGEGEMDFNKLADWTNKFVAEKGLVSKSDLETTLGEKEKQFTSNLDGHSYLTMKVPHLLMKHFKEFGEILDPQEVVKKAEELKNYNLDSVYDGMVADRRQKISEEALNKKLEEARLAGIEEGKKAAMGSRSPSPTDSGSPEMSQVRDRMLGKTSEGDEDPYKNLSLDDGDMIARMATREFLENQNG